MKRSGIRGWSPQQSPDSVSLHPGYTLLFITARLWRAAPFTRSG